MPSWDPQKRIPRCLTMCRRSPIHLMPLPIPSLQESKEPGPRPWIVINHTTALENNLEAGTSQTVIGDPGVKGVTAKWTGEHEGKDLIADTVGTGIDHGVDLVIGLIIGEVGLEVRPETGSTGKE